MKNITSKDEMNQSDIDTVDDVQKLIKKRASRKMDAVAKKSDIISDGKDIRYDDMKNNSVVPGNLVTDAELIPFGRRMSSKSVAIDSFISIDSAIEAQKLLERFINEILVSDVDYGFIQGYGKPSLLKSGAEKLCNFYRLIPRVEVTSRVDEFHSPFFSREVKITLLDSINETIRGEGLGSCNSKEAKYQKEDPYALQNVILKMAKKRALIDAVLNVSGLSSRFTQDIEDIEVMECGIAESKPITMKQYKYLTDLIRTKGISRKEYFAILADKFQVESLKQLNSAQMSQLISLFKDSKKY